MRGAVTTISDVVEAFKQRGFEFIGKSDDGWFRLYGELALEEATITCACEIELDPKFFNIPRIRLLEIPPRLPSVVPHLGPEGHLCYIAEGTVILDIFDPIGQSLACLERAGYVLGKILKGEMVEDLEEEFYAYWGGPFCMVDMQSEHLGQQKCIAGKIGNRSVWAVTDDKDRTTRKLKALGLEVTDHTVLTYRIRTNAKPRPMTTDWPPKTVKDILSWQGKLDSNCRRKIDQRIHEGAVKKVKSALILIESPLMTYGFTVFYKHTEEQRPKKKFSERRNLAYGLEVMPMSIVRIDDRYIAERNVPSIKTLSGKSIAVVGCGTIGGYLSEMLVKAGAGTSGGKLTLVDPDSLYPQNIGRHRLGFPNLFSNKAVGMVDELRRLAPGVDACALPVDIMQAQLGKLDLLIDATGEEALGHWLCEHYLESVPMLSVWIEGPGTAVRALLRTNSAGACYRCLWQNNRKGQFRTVVGSLPTLLAGHGCEGLYVPFPASVSVQAASLGAEMALDWVNGVQSPSLRTKLIDTSCQLSTSDCDPPRDMDCPACPS